MSRKRLDSSTKKMADEVPRKAKKKSSSGGKSVGKDSATKRKQLEASIRSQVAAEEKAHRIVEEIVLEDSISERYLLEIGNYITPSHYADITEERAIAKVCGYPLCSNALTQVPKQKYKISVKTNRVFDITERKCYCSNYCYKASKYFESQIPTSPVWTRIGESPKKFTVLKSTDLSFKPIPGEVLVGSEKLVLNHDNLRDGIEPVVQNENRISNTNINEKYNSDHTHAIADNTESDNAKDSMGYSVKEMRDNESKGAKDRHVARSSIATMDYKADVTDKLRGLEVSPSSEEMKKDISDGQHKNNATKDTDFHNRVCLPPQRERNNIKSGGIKSKGNYSQKTQTSDKIKKKDEMVQNAKEVFINSIKDTLIQWFTESTYGYLNMSSNTSSDEIMDDNGVGSDKEHFTARTSRSFNTHMKPTSDGDDDDEEEKQETESQSKLNPENIKIIEKNTNREEGFPCVVPPVDSKSQLTLRRQIVLQKLTQVLPEILVKTTYNTGEVTTHFTAIVRTFRLDSQNTMFKPLQWKVLATALIYLLKKHLVKESDSLTRDGHSMEKMLVHLGLTQQDIHKIIEPLQRKIHYTTFTMVTDTSHAQSRSYSLMEELD